MVAGAAGGEDKAFGAAQLLAVDIEAAKVGAGVGIGEAAAHGVFHGLGLLVDLLEHVMVEVAAVAITHIPIDLLEQLLKLLDEPINLLLLLLTARQPMR